MLRDQLAQTLTDLGPTKPALNIFFIDFHRSLLPQLNREGELKGKLVSLELNLSLRGYSHLSSEIRHLCMSRFLIIDINQLIISEDQV